MAYENAGFTRVTRTMVGAINRRWFYNYIQFFTRYSGFFLLGLIAYLHFIFDDIALHKAHIVLWMLSYLSYLAFLEILRYTRTTFYDSDWFIFIRILSNILLISWLLNEAPLARGIFVFAYLVPFISATVYFPKNLRVQALVYILSIVGILISSVVFETENPLTFLQMLAIAIALGIILINIRRIYTMFLNVPEGISDITKRLHSTININEIVSGICEGAQMISGAEGIFVLIVDPGRRIYLLHQLKGLNLNPFFSMNELIQQCNVIQKGESYEKDELQGTIDEEHFKKFFSPPPRSILVEPIRGLEKKVLGLILVGGMKPVQFDVLTKRFFRHFCVSVATAVETSLAYRKARLGAPTHKSVTEQLLEAEKESEIAKILVAQVANLISNTDGCILHRFESESKNLVPTAGMKPSPSGKLIPWEASHLDPKSLGQSIMRLGEGIAGNALQYREIIVAPDIREHPWFTKSAQINQFISLMSAPIIDADSQLPIGTLSVQSNQKDAFTTEDQAILLSLAEQGSISMARAREFDEWRLKGGILKQIFESVLEIDYEADEEVVSQQLADIAKEILPFGMIRIRIYDVVTGDLVSVAAAGYPEEDRPILIGKRLPLVELGQFLKKEYQVERSFLIPSNAPGWKEFVEQYLYIPKAEKIEIATWDRYDAFFTPLLSETRDMIGYIAWDRPKDNLRPPKRIIEAVGAFASMASWSIDLTRAYRRIGEQRNLIKSFIDSTIENLAATSDINTMGKVAVNIGRELLHAEACSFYSVLGNELELTNSTYLNNTEYIGRRKPIQTSKGIGLSSWVAATLEPLYFKSQAEYQKHPGWAGETDQLRYLDSTSCESLLLVPILSHTGNCLGVLSFENKLGQGNISGFSKTDLETAQHLAVGIRLAFELGEQLNNVRKWEQQMLKDDIHELKNHYYYGVRIRIENALFWLKQGNSRKAEDELIVLDRHSETILNELYSLHNDVQKKYYKVENFREALEQLVRNLLLRDASLHNRENHNIRIECSNDIQLSALLRYVFIRIATGSLMNAIMHSGFLDDSNIGIRVSVKQKDKYIYLTIKDNGNGVQQIKEGYGIGRMRALVGDLKNKGVDIKLDLSSSEGNGFEVKIIASAGCTEV